MSVPASAHPIAHAHLLAPEWVRVSWVGGGTSTYAMRWLRVQAAEAESSRDATRAAFRAETARWTDGANHTELERAGDDAVTSIHVERGGQALALRAGRRVQRIAAEQLWLAERPDPVAAVEPVAWDGARRWPAWDWQRLVAEPEPGARREFLASYLAYGVAFVAGVPRRPRALRELAAVVGSIAPTHLGELFDLKAAAGSRHVGETPMGVPLHIDMVYKQHPPGAQALHAYRQIASGGENEFVDARRVLQQLEPGAVAQLSTTPLDFVAVSETVHFRGRHPVLRLDADGAFAGVAYNSHKVQFPATVPPAFYPAFDRFRTVAEDERNIFRFLLPQDGAVLFDNRRILHARRPFDDPRRHVVGCYFDDDELRGTFRMLARQA